MSSKATTSIGPNVLINSLVLAGKTKSEFRIWIPPTAHALSRDSWAPQRWQNCRARENCDDVTCVTDRCARCHIELRTRFVCAVPNCKLIYSDLCRNRKYIFPNTSRRTAR